MIIFRFEKGQFRPEAVSRMERNPAGEFQLDAASPDEFYGYSEEGALAYYQRRPDMRGGVIRFQLHVNYKHIMPQEYRQYSFGGETLCQWDKKKPPMPCPKKIEDFPVLDAQSKAKLDEHFAALTAEAAEDWKLQYGFERFEEASVGAQTEAEAEIDPNVSTPTPAQRFQIFGIFRFDWMLFLEAAKREIVFVKAIKAVLSGRILRSELGEMYIPTLRLVACLSENSLNNYVKYVKNFRAVQGYDGRARPILLGIYALLTKTLLGFLDLRRLRCDEQIQKQTSVPLSELHSQLQDLMELPRPKSAEQMHARIAPLQQFKAVAAATEFPFGLSPEAICYAYELLTGRLPPAMPEKYNPLQYAQLQLKFLKQWMSAEDDAANQVFVDYLNYLWITQPQSDPANLSVFHKKLHTTCMGQFLGYLLEQLTAMHLLKLTCVDEIPADMQDGIVSFFQKDELVRLPPNIAPEILPMMLWLTLDVKAKDSKRKLKCIDGAQDVNIQLYCAARDFILDTAATYDLGTRPALATESELKLATLDHFKKMWQAAPQEIKQKFVIAFRAADTTSELKDKVTGSTSISPDDVFQLLVENLTSMSALMTVVDCPDWFFDFTTKQREMLLKKVETKYLTCKKMRILFEIHRILTELVPEESTLKSQVDESRTLTDLLIAVFEKIEASTLSDTDKKAAYLQALKMRNSETDLINGFKVKTVFSFAKLLKYLSHIYPPKDVNAIFDKNIQWIYRSIASEKDLLILIQFYHLRNFDDDKMQAFPASVLQHYLTMGADKFEKLLHAIETLTDDDFRAVGVPIAEKPRLARYLNEALCNWLCQDFPKHFELQYQMRRALLSQLSEAHRVKLADSLLAFIYSKSEMVDHFIDTARSQLSAYEQSAEHFAMTGRARTFSILLAIRIPQLLSSLSFYMPCCMALIFDLYKVVYSSQAGAESCRPPYTFNPKSMVLFQYMQVEFLDLLPAVFSEEMLSTAIYAYIPWSKIHPSTVVLLKDKSVDLSLEKTVLMDLIAIDEFLNAEVPEKKIPVLVLMALEDANFSKKVARRFDGKLDTAVDWLQLATPAEKTMLVLARVSSDDQQFARNLQRLANNHQFLADVFDQRGKNIASCFYHLSVTQQEIFSAFLYAAIPTYFERMQDDVDCRSEQFIATAVIGVVTQSVRRLCEKYQVKNLESLVDKPIADKSTDIPNFIKIIELITVSEKFSLEFAGLDGIIARWKRMVEVFILNAKPDVIRQCLEKIEASDELLHNATGSSYMDQCLLEIKRLLPPTANYSLPSRFELPELNMSSLLSDYITFLMVMYSLEYFVSTARTSSSLLFPIHTHAARQANRNDAEARLDEIRLGEYAEAADNSEPEEDARSSPMELVD